MTQAAHCALARPAGVAVVSSVGSVRGATKPFNQDAFVVEHVFVEHHAMCGAPLAAGTLIGVFDGHGKHGHHVAHLVGSQVGSWAEEGRRSEAGGRTGRPAGRLADG